MESRFVVAAPREQLWVAIKDPAMVPHHAYPAVRYEGGAHPRSLYKAKNGLSGRMRSRPII